MMKKVLNLFIVLSLLALLVPAVALAQDGDELMGQEYTIQKDDWLSKLAEKYLGNVLAYNAIVEATNQMAEQNPDKFNKIDNADLVEPGWVIWIPEATAAPERGLLARLEDRGIMVVGTSADYPPYESVDEAGEFIGFDMDLIREVGARMGLEVQISDMAFDALIAALQENKVDAVIAAMQYSPERDEKVDFSVPYHYQKDAFLVSQDAGIEMSSPMDAAGYNIGVQTGTLQEQWALDNLVDQGLLSEDQLFRYERVDQGALDVAAGRLDMLFINADPAKELAEKMGLELALVTSDTVVGGQSVAVPEGETGFKAELDRIITELQNEGVIEQLQLKWNIP
jgi:polar amino acid transport system substrate-binding protein